MDAIWTTESESSHQKDSYSVYALSSICYVFVQGHVPGGRRKPVNESLEVKVKSLGDSALRTCDQIAVEGNDY